MQIQDVRTSPRQLETSQVVDIVSHQSGNAMKILAQVGADVQG
jgi:hypothetical protein